jgi:hypothetical protein
MATQQRWQPQWQWLTATAMAMGSCDGNGDGDGNRDSVINNDRDGNGNGNGDGHGKGIHYKGRVASSCGGVLQHFWRGTPCLHPHGHKGKCIHQCCIMGVTLLRVFAPLQGGGVPDSSIYILFLLIIYIYCSVY